MLRPGLLVRRTVRLRLSARERAARCRLVGAVALLAAALALAVGCGGDIAFSFGGRVFAMRPDGSGRIPLTGRRVRPPGGEGDGAGRSAHTAGSTP